MIVYKLDIKQTHICDKIKESEGLKERRHIDMKRFATSDIMTKCEILNKAMQATEEDRFAINIWNSRYQLIKYCKGGGGYSEVSPSMTGNEAALYLDAMYNAIIYMR